MISPLPGVTTLKPGSATFPLPGIGAEVVDDRGQKVEHGGGYLTLTRPWPAMLRGIYGDPERYRETYWSKFEGRYFAGDGARVDDDGCFWLMGRVDDVMNISGHRVSTTEVESALVDHPYGGRGRVRRRQGRDDRPGDHRLRHAQGPTSSPTASTARRCASTSPPRSAASAVRRRSSSPTTCPRPAAARSCAGCSRDVAEGRDLGDTTTLADAGVVEEIKRRAETAPQED